MKYRILNSALTGKKAIIRNVLRWGIYTLFLIFFFCIQVSLPFIKWQPYLIIALACAVSTFESELGSFIFSGICGLMNDVAIGGLFGFTSIWLSPCCFFITLLSVNLIHRNVVNYLWLNAFSIIIIDFMELLFKHFIWRDNGWIIYFNNYMLPATICTIVLSFALYYLVCYTYKKLRTDGLDERISASFTMPK